MGQKRGGELKKPSLGEDERQWDRGTGRQVEPRPGQGAFLRRPWRRVRSQGACAEVGGAQGGALKEPEVVPFGWSGSVKRTIVE